MFFVHAQKVVAFPPNETVALLSDAVLEERLRAAVENERMGIVSILRLLAEFDRRQLYHIHGCDSLFSFCQRGLGLRAGAACRRIDAARLLDRFPQIDAMLVDGRLCLTTLCLLKPVLTKDNVDVLLERAARRSKMEVMSLVAEISPRAALRNSVTPLAPAASGVLGTNTASPLQEQVGLATPPAPLDGAGPPANSLYQLNVAVSGEFVGKLNEAKLVLSHKFPSGDLAAILEEGIDLIIKKGHRRRGLTKKHGSAKKTEGSSIPPSSCEDSRASGKPTAAYIDLGVKVTEPAKPNIDDREKPQDIGVKERAPATPAVATPRAGVSRLPITTAVRREVWLRDGGSCTFVGTLGQRCGSRFQLEFDHVVPVAFGGKSTSDNIRLLCRAHNQHRADLVFGKAKMAQHRAHATASGGGG